MAYDADGDYIEVPIDTAVKTKDGKHYLLTEADLAEQAAKESAYKEKARDRKKGEIVEESKDPASIEFTYNVGTQDKPNNIKVTATCDLLSYLTGMLKSFDIIDANGAPGFSNQSDIYFDSENVHSLKKAQIEDLYLEVFWRIHNARVAQNRIIKELDGLTNDEIEEKDGRSDFKTERDRLNDGISGFKP